MSVVWGQRSIIFSSFLLSTWWHKWARDDEICVALTEPISFLSSFFFSFSPFSLFFFLIKNKDKCGDHLPNALHSSSPLPVEIPLGLHFWDCEPNEPWCHRSRQDSDRKFRVISDPSCDHIFVIKLKSTLFDRGSQDYFFVWPNFGNVSSGHTIVTPHWKKLEKELNNRTGMIRIKNE